MHKNKERLPFAFKYLTYKPGIDILTESQQYRLCIDLLNEGYHVYCMDDAIIHLCDDRIVFEEPTDCLLYTSPSPRDLSTSRMPSSA